MTQDSQCRESLVDGSYRARKRIGGQARPGIQIPDPGGRGFHGMPMGIRFPPHGTQVLRFTGTALTRTWRKPPLSAPVRSGRGPRGVGLLDRRDSGSRVSTPGPSHRPASTQRETGIRLGPSHIGSITFSVTLTPVPAVRALRSNLPHTVHATGLSSLNPTATGVFISTRCSLAGSIPDQKLSPSLHRPPA